MMDYDEFNEATDLVADRASELIPTACVVIVATTEGYVSYRSKLPYAELNSILAKIGKPLNESEELAL